MRTRSLRLAILTGSTALILTAAPVLALTSVSGNAYGEYVDVTTAAVVPVHVTSGPLPSVTLPATGSTGVDANLASACAPDPGCYVLSTGALVVHTEGNLSPGAVRSTASVLGVNALAGFGALTATAVSSECNIGPDGSPTGGSTFDTLAIQGVAQTGTTFGPNTSVNLIVNNVIVGRVVLNEQSYDAATNTLTVNAIHIYLLSGGALGTGEIIIAHVECDANPLTGPTPVVPESPLTILLPLMAIAVVGGALLVMSRRNPSFLQR